MKNPNINIRDNRIYCLKYQYKRIEASVQLFGKNCQTEF